MKTVTFQKRITGTFFSVLALAICYLSSPAIYSLQEANQNQTQDYTEYKGKVIDNDTRKPLIFADISVKSSNISTITNKEGEFLLKVPNTFSNGSIIVSFLGYETLEFPLSNFSKKQATIRLSPVLTSLDQVNINAPKDAKSLVKIALDKKSNSYVGDKLIMTGFYRETIKKGRKNASLAEAVVKLFKEPYQSGKKDKIEHVKSRKNTNYSRLDTLALKLQGGPFSTLYSDIVKYPEYIFDEETFPYYNFSFDNSSEINDRKVYVINFQQQANVITPLYSGKLYIDAMNQTLVSAQYHLNVENKDEVIKLFLRKKPPKVKVEPIQASYKVDYKSTNGKWYYSYSNIQLAFRVKWRKKLFGSTYTLNMEMAVTDWKEDAVTKIDPKKRIRPSIILTDEATGFSDPEFWGEYNIIEPEKSIESAIRKIKKQLSKLEKAKR